MQQEKQVKDYQPPDQEEQDHLSFEQLEGNPEGWDKEDIKDITDEASNRDPEGVLRQTLRGDETKGDADERDIAGSIGCTVAPDDAIAGNTASPGKCNILLRSAQ